MDRRITQGVKDKEKLLGRKMTEEEYQEYLSKKDMKQKKIKKYRENRLRNKERKQSIRNIKEITMTELKKIRLKRGIITKDGITIG